MLISRKTEVQVLKGKKKRYSKDMPRMLYSFFAGYKDAGVPSFSKFARSIGITLADLEEFRKVEKFNEAYAECSEIRRDYLLEGALTKRFDASTVKFILAAEFEMGDKKEDLSEKNLDVTLRVIGGEENEN